MYNTQIENQESEQHRMMKMSERRDQNINIDYLSVTNKMIESAHTLSLAKNTELRQA